MMGLRRARKFELRESFFELLSRYIRVSEAAVSRWYRPVAGANLHDRLDYLFNDRNIRWDTSQHSFWVKQCLDIMLDGIDAKAPVTAPPEVAQLPLLRKLNACDSTTHIPKAKRPEFIAAMEVVRSCLWSFSISPSFRISQKMLQACLRSTRHFWTVSAMCRHLQLRSHFELCASYHQSLPTTCGLSCFHCSGSFVVLSSGSSNLNVSGKY